MKRNIFIFVGKRAQLTSTDSVLAAPAVTCFPKVAVSPKFLLSSKDHQIRQGFPGVRGNP